MRAAATCDACGRGDRDIVPVALMVGGHLAMVAHLCKGCADDVLESVRRAVRRRERYG